MSAVGTYAYKPIAESEAQLSEAIAYDRAKRLLDVAIAISVLAIFSPIWLLISLLIRLSSSGPILYTRDDVIGKHGKAFRIFKFRTMVHGGDDRIHKEALDKFVSGLSIAPTDSRENAQPVYKITRDSRVTWLGRILRKTGIDEIPQFINVLRGEMSVVGPRPSIQYECDRYSEYERQRLLVRPGITGLYQVLARSQVPFAEMVRLDLEYIARRSLWFDLWIMAKTPWVMMTGKGAY